MSVFEILLLVLKIVGTLALFLYGMKLISESLQKAAGPRLRSILFSFTSTRLKSLFSGLFITAIIQSSSTATVMIAGFVNAGLISLIDAGALIIGTNIGTTIKFWLIYMLGYNFDISQLSLPIFGVGFLLYVFTRNKIKILAEFLLGIGLMFLGLYFMQNILPEDEIQMQISHYFSHENSPTFLTVLGFVSVGVLLTSIMQSSSALMALTIVLSQKGWISYELAIALILGENIGTTATVNIATLIANKNAKRSALFHFLINLFGVILMLPFFYYFVDFVKFVTTLLTGQSPEEYLSSTTIALCIAHTSFNLFLGLFFVGLIKQVVALTEWIIPESKGGKIYNNLAFLSHTANSTSEIAVESAKREIIQFASNIQKMYQLIPKFLIEKDESDYKVMFEKIKDYEEYADKKEIEIAEYLTKLTEHELSTNSSQRISGMNRIIDNLETIADVCVQMAYNIDQKNDQKCWFDQEMRDALKILFDITFKAFDVMNHNLNMDYKKVEIKEALSIEQQINDYRNILRERHLIDLKDKKYTYQTGVYYSGLYASLEKIGDHLINISEAIVNAHPNKHRQ